MVCECSLCGHVIFCTDCLVSLGGTGVIVGLGVPNVVFSKGISCFHDLRSICVHTAVSPIPKNAMGL